MSDRGKTFNWNSKHELFHFVPIGHSVKRGVAGSILLYLPISGLVWSLYACAALWRAVYGTTVRDGNFFAVAGFHFVSICMYIH